MCSDSRDESTRTFDTAHAPHREIGPYRLIQLIGEGGMGEVWLAEQKEPVRRRVALKLVRAGMDTREVVARFRSELQALAVMNHPAIAKVFDAGSAPDGRPYFAMEYVAGISITQYCDKHKLSTRERLELLILVCEGVQHAHQKAIIHRDLKPSNILVTEVDGHPAVKIIDFGIAKALTQGLVADAACTRVGAIIGTPEYMSPEQSDSTADIDTRSDVYSLGVILYEQLTSKLPLEFRKSTLPDIVRRLQEEDPVPPSTKLRTLGEDSIPAATNRGTEPANLRRMLSGDLDAITLKVLEKERSRRYGSPAEFAADLRRYLRNEPVTARPASFTYRSRKYLRRHRFGATVVTGLALLIVAFTVSEGIQLRRITREKDRADRITAYMTAMFKVPNPSESRGSAITAREILDRASSQINADLAKDPELKAQIMHAMGDVYWNLGLYTRAETLFREAAGIRRRVLGQKHPDTLSSMSKLSHTLTMEGRYSEAEQLGRETLDSARQSLGPNHPQTLNCMVVLSASLQRLGRFEEAEKLLREVVDVRTRTLGSEDAETATGEGALANVLDRAGRHSEAEALDREVLAIRRRVLGPDHPDTLRTISNLASSVREAGRKEEAEKLTREALESEQRVFGPEHPDTLKTMMELGDCLADEGRFPEAEALMLKTREIQQRVLGPTHPSTALSTYNLGCTAAQQGQVERAITLIREAVDHGLAPSVIVRMEKDPDLALLRGSLRFQELVRHAHEVAAAERKGH